MNMKEAAEYVGTVVVATLIAGFVFRVSIGVANVVCDKIQSCKAKGEAK